MPNLWDVLQNIASITRHVSDLQKQVDATDASLGDLERRMLERVHQLEVAVATLQAAQATTRETIRAEMATAVADLRVRYAEDQAGRSRPELNEGGETPP